MKHKFDPIEWADDFKEFLNSPEIQPPLHLTDSIAEFVQKDLNPTVWLILTKLSLIHIFVGSLSLLICAQFGMGRGSMVSNIFAGYEELMCMSFCGALFLGFTTLIAVFILSETELKKIRLTGYSPLMVLGLVSLTVFFCFGAHIILNIAAVWFLGGLIAGILVTEGGILMKNFALRA